MRAPLKTAVASWAPSINIIIIINFLLSRNYQLIVAQRKFDVLKTNICPKSEALRANMLGLRTSNFQGQLSDQ